MCSTSSSGMMPFHGAIFTRRSDRAGTSLGWEVTMLLKLVAPSFVVSGLWSSCATCSPPSDAVTASEEMGNEGRDSAISGFL